MTETERLRQLLVGASRTFALTVPMLPSPLVEIVTLSYLLLRIADTIEDAYHWPKEQRLKMLEEFIIVLKQPANQAKAKIFAESFASGSCGLENAGHLEVLYQTPFIMEQFSKLAVCDISVVTEHITRTVREMQHWLGQLDENNQLNFQRLKQLTDYCYSVAGIVGEMLTTLFALHSYYLTKEQLLYLRTLEVGCATGLQLTNIIKDSFSDHREGRHYIPQEYLPFGQNDDPDKIIPIFTLAFRYLTQGIEYVRWLPVEEIGIRKSCLMPIVLAGATLDHLFKNREELYSGEDVKISRTKVYELLQQVDQVISDNWQIIQLWEQLTKIFNSADTKYTTIKPYLI